MQLGKKSDGLRREGFLVHTQYRAGDLDTFRGDLGFRGCHLLLESPVFNILSALHWVSMRFILAFLLVAGLEAQTDAAKYSKAGHSMQCDAFDEGPRQKPWAMDGIGKTHFPITAKNPEVQKWFDQGNTLLHSFWY